MISFQRKPKTRAGLRFVYVGMAMLALVSVCGGCRINDISDARRLAKVVSFGSRPEIRIERKSDGPLAPLQNMWAKRRVPTDRTSLFLRQYNLADGYQSDPEEVVQIMQANCLRHPSMNQVHAVAELSEIEAEWAVKRGNKERGAKLYATAVLHAYQFLFDPKLNIQRNAYDPQFRSICDIYNRSLAGMLGVLCNESDFQSHDHMHRIGDDQLGLEFEIRIEGRWGAEEFERFEPVNDYTMEGIENSYRTFGLGVPLIAIRKKDDTSSEFEKYYPPSLSLPMTAFLEVLPKGPGDATRKAIIHMYDPLESSSAEIAGRNVPLESEYTLPLAYYLRDPLLNSNVLATATLLSPDIASNFYGLYMIEPYNPKKIPVVMVHGFWSSPVTWLQMFNDLRADPAIRENYQFWFYMYPTGQPFWISAQQMRADLNELQKDVDPHHESEALKQMVLVGHSMGGLVSRMQTTDSGEHFWNILSDEPFDEMQGTPEQLQRLRELVFFEPSEKISRVITIASPHRGTKYANTATRWLSHKLFSLPKLLQTEFSEFVSKNKGELRNTKSLTIPTSVDSLAPESPFIQAMQSADKSERVIFHNIYGDASRSVGTRRLSPNWSSPGDGVVAVSSAQITGVDSQIAVDAAHMEVHRHPQSILEVRRIMLEHLEMLGMINGSAARKMVKPASYQLQKTSDLFD